MLFKSENRATGDPKSFRMRIAASNTLFQVGELWREFKLVKLHCRQSFIQGTSNIHQPSAGEEKPEIGLVTA